MYFNFSAASLETTGFHEKKIEKFNESYVVIFYVKLISIILNHLFQENVEKPHIFIFEHFDFSIKPGFCRSCSRKVEISRF
jgi:hypothetical protein